MTRLLKVFLVIGTLVCLVEPNKQRSITSIAHMEIGKKKHRIAGRVIYFGGWRS